MRLLIERFGLAPLPVEATLFANTYRSDVELGPGGPAGSAGVGLYCEDPPSRSLFHRLAFDEVWHFYGGDPIRLVLLHPDGRDEEIVLGPEVLAGNTVQHVIPAGVWQAGELVPGGAWGLFGCTMAPGFTSACFEGGRIGDLVAVYPARRVDIERLGIPADHDLNMPDDCATKNP